MKPAHLVLAVAMSGCFVTGTAELAPPRAGELPSPNVASIATPLGELFDFPADALTSHASLARMDDEAMCFDLLIRRPVMLPKDDRPLVLKISVEVDGAPANQIDRALPTCTAELPCLPPDSALQRFVAETDRRVRVEGERLCFPRLPRPRRELVLGARPGVTGWKFRFRLTGGAG